METLTREYCLALIVGSGGTRDRQYNGYARHRVISTIVLKGMKPL